MQRTLAAEHVLFCTGLPNAVISVLYVVLVAAQNRTCIASLPLRRLQALLRNGDLAVVAVGVLAVLPLPLVAAAAGAAARHFAGQRREGVEGPAAA